MVTPLLSEPCHALLKGGNVKTLDRLNEIKIALEKLRGEYKKEAKQFSEEGNKNDLYYAGVADGVTSSIGEIEKYIAIEKL